MPAERNSIMGAAGGPSVETDWRDDSILESRRPQVYRKAAGSAGSIACGKRSVAGAVSQRACVFCGSRVVLYPITDALHIIHGPIGCAAYTWDIRGAQSSGRQLYRNSFSTDLREKDVVFGGENKLESALLELIEMYAPKAAFVYSTCIVGIIGDDVDRICRSVATASGIPVIPVQSPGFSGTKKDGYKAACDALYKLVGTGDTSSIGTRSINLLGDFNIAGETWVMKKYFERMGVEVVSCITGDGRVDEVRRCHGARLNLVQCSGSMLHLARYLERDHAIPFHRVSFFGIEDTAAALYDTAKRIGDADTTERTRALVREEVARIQPELQKIRAQLQGKKAAIYVGGAFKAFSLVRALRTLGMKSVLVGSQTGNADDYSQLQELCDEGTIIVDDASTLELARFCVEADVDLLIGGVKERPIAYKMGIGFCDHNHERKECLAGFEGMLNFAREVRSSVLSPVWQFAPRRASVHPKAEARS